MLDDPEAVAHPIHPYKETHTHTNLNTHTHTHTRNIYTHISQVLDDPEVVEHSKGFVADVVADDSLQRTGGTAIWNSFQYSFQPKLVRVCVCVWFCAFLNVPRLGSPLNPRPYITR